MATTLLAPTTGQVSSYIPGFSIPSSDYTQRISSIRAEAGRQGLDAILISSDIGIYYTTGITFHPLERKFFVLIPVDETKPLKILVPKMEALHFHYAQELSGYPVPYEVSSYEEFQAVPGGNWHDQLPHLLEGIQSLGVEGSMPKEVDQKIQEQMSGQGGEVVLSDAVERVRMVKSPAEIEEIRQAGRFVVEGMQNLKKKATKDSYIGYAFSVGKNLKSKIYKTFYANGAVPDLLHTDATFAVWPNPLSEMPHYVPTLHDQLERSGILFGFVTNGGEWAEAEQTVLPKDATEEELKYYELAHEAFDLGKSRLKPGVRCADIDKATRDFFKEKGVEQYILHRTGHGIGLEHHEGPFLSEGSDDVLQEGMVVTVEPGLYVPGVGGFRISRTFLITKEGAEDITPFPDDVESNRVGGGGWLGRVLTAISLAFNKDQVALWQESARRAYSSVQF